MHFGSIDIILLHSGQQHVSVAHVTIFRVVTPKIHTYIYITNQRDTTWQYVY